MCSNCRGNYEDPNEYERTPTVNRTAAISRVPEKPIRLAPEQEACPHDKLKWLGYQGLFVCVEPDGGCGAEFVMPELEEALGLALCND